MTPSTIYIRPAAWGFVVFFGLFCWWLGISSADLPLTVKFTALVAILIQATNLYLREEEYLSLCLDCDITRRDLVARSAMVVFDALLYLGIVSGAGLVLSWWQVLPVALLFTLGGPVLVVRQARNVYNPGAAKRGHQFALWPAILALASLAIPIALAGSTVVQSGPQPFLLPLLIGTFALFTRPNTRYLRLTSFLRIASVIGSLGLLTAWLAKVI